MKTNCYHIQVSLWWEVPKEISLHVLWSHVISLGSRLTFCSEHLPPGIKVRHGKNSDFMDFACYISSDFSLYPEGSGQPSPKLDLFHCDSLTWQNDQIPSPVAHWFSACIGNRDKAHKTFSQSKSCTTQNCHPQNTKSMSLRNIASSLPWLRSETLTSYITMEEREGYIMKSN